MKSRSFRPGHPGLRSKGQHETNYFQGSDHTFAMMLIFARSFIEPHRTESEDAAADRYHFLPSMHLFDCVDLVIDTRV